MYIISKHKDYYDGVVGSVGIDKTLVYERETIEITENKLMLKEFQSNRRNRGWMGNNRDNPFLNIGYADIDSKKTKKYVDKDFFIVGFCGKLYLGWKLYYKVEERSVLGLMKDVTKTDIVYDYENVKEFIRESYWRGNLKDDVKYVMSYDPINMFRELNAPIFIYDSERRRPRTNDALFINPILKDYEFYKVVDAFTAFTELQMFMGGVLGVGEKEIVEIEDKYKIGQHGFDKWSFRKEPEKKI
jgi:hypothetical protein